MQAKYSYLLATLLVVVAVVSAVPALAQLDGTLGPIEPQPVLRPIEIGQQEDVSFEELTDCGLYSQESRLACTIEIKRVNGYGGVVDSFGSFEHVLFCIDWNGNGAFANNEVVGEVSVHVHDEGAGATPPWRYAVYRDITPPGGVRTTNGGVGTATTATVAPSFRALAILSWNTAPTGCGFVPIFGNRLTFQIRVDPIR